MSAIFAAPAQLTHRVPQRLVQPNGNQRLRYAQLYAIFMHNILIQVRLNRRSIQL